jgi:hypothetical protein
MEHFIDSAKSAGTDFAQILEIFNAKTMFTGIRGK